MKMRLKIKIFPPKLYAFNIDVCFNMMHIAKNCLHYWSLRNLDFLKQYDYLQLYIYLYD